jgi:hypothetical protein
LRGPTSKFRETKEDQHLGVSEEDSNFLYMCNILIHNMGFHETKVNRVLLKNWDRFNNDINTAIEILLKESEGEEVKQEIIDATKPNLKKIRSDILKQINPHFNEEKMENGDDDDLCIKRLISKTLLIKPTSKQPEIII